jgi:hypothetical protein
VVIPLKIVEGFNPRCFEDIFSGPSLLATCLGDNYGVFPTFSTGLIDGWVPEPSSLVLFGTE